MSDMVASCCTGTDGKVDEYEFPLVLLVIVMQVTHVGWCSKYVHCSASLKSYDLKNNFFEQDALSG